MRGDEPPRTTTLRDYGQAIHLRRRFVAVVTVICTVVFAALSIVLPPTYQAVTTVIPVSSSDRASGLSQLGLSLGELGLQGLSRSGSPLMFPEIVHSRRVLNQILEKSYSVDVEGKPVSLEDVLQPGPRSPLRREKALKRIRRSISVVVDRRTGVLTIEVEAPRPEIAAGVANSLDTLLQRFLIESLTTQAGQNRVFIEDRLRDVESRVREHEEQLQAFRERNLRIGNSPRLLLEENRLSRSLREQEEVYLTLRRQYELARIDEQRTVPAISVLDQADIPARRHSPRRLTITLLGALVGFAVGSGVAVYRST